MTQQNETEHQLAEPEQPARGAAAPQPAPAPTSPQSALVPEAPQSAPAAEPLQPAPAADAAAAAPSEPVYPSPYLDGGEGMPQTYLAPPQQGQPSYGTARRGPGGRPSGPAQPRYGQPPVARPRAGAAAAARRDPAIASPWLRLAASTLDWFIIILVSVIAFWSPLSQIWRELEAITTHYPDLTSPTAQAAINSISRNPANQRTLVFWLLALFGIALVYYWVQHAAWGATVGKRAAGLRVVRAADRSRIGVRQAGIRAVAFLTGPAILMLLVTPINIVGGVLWLADAGLPLVDSQAQSLHDKLAGTVVVRQRWLQQRSRGAQSW